MRDFGCCPAQGGGENRDFFVSPWIHLGRLRLARQSRCDTQSASFNSAIVHFDLIRKWQRSLAIFVLLLSSDSDEPIKFNLFGKAGEVASSASKKTITGPV